MSEEVIIEIDGKRFRLDLLNGAKLGHIRDSDDLVIYVNGVAVAVFKRDKD